MFQQRSSWPTHLDAEFLWYIKIAVWWVSPVFSCDNGQFDQVVIAKAFMSQMYFKTDKT